jgi:hypothetical protein
VILVHASGSDLLPWIEKGLSSRAYKVWSGPVELDMLSFVDAIVLVVEALEARTVDQVWHMRVIAPLTPIVICTRYTMDSARQLVLVPAQRVVWLDESPVALAEALGRLSVVPLRVRLFEAIRDAGTLRGAMLLALERLLTAEDASLTVAKLATVIGVPESTLRRQWRVLVQPEVRLGLHAIIQWVLLVRAHEYHVRGASWASAAAHVGTTLKTLRAAARATVGSALEELGKVEEHTLNLRLAVIFDPFLPRIRATS